MIRYSDIIHMPVLCTDGGHKIGEIKDILICTKNKEIISFAIEKRNNSFRKRFILYKDVCNFGSDAFIIENQSCILTQKELEKIAKYSKEDILIGQRVYSKHGIEIGTVKNIIFDLKMGKIDAIEVSAGLIYDIYNGRKIVPLYGNVEFSEDNILIDREAYEEILYTHKGIKKLLMKER